MSNLLKIQFKKIYEQSKLPTKGSLGAAAYDAYVHSITFEKGDTVVLGLGFATAIPAGYKGVIVPRSGFTKVNWVMNNNLGKIDSDYRGEWIMKIKPINGRLEDTPLPFSVGDRCCQIYFEKVLDVEFEEVKHLPETDRGEGGFGSTGKN
jgi:dUTP pyrophosphatase